MVLGTHNGFAVDWPVLYWSMLRKGLEPYDTLKAAGVVGVLDALYLFKPTGGAVGLPPEWVAKLPRTSAGNASFSNSNLYATFYPKARALQWHTANADAFATGENLRSRPGQALLFAPSAARTAAFRSLDALVVSVHDAHNQRFVTATAPAAKRKKSVCQYCKGAVGPPHATQRTCPKKRADEAAAAAT